MCVLIFSANLSETFLTLRRIQRDIILNVCRYLCKVPVILLIFQPKVYFLDRFSKNTQIQNFMKIRPMGVELFHVDGQTVKQTDRQTDGQTGRHEGANSRLSQLCETSKRENTL